jgi:hypothetical protein
VSYLDALDHIHKLNAGTVATVALVLFFCLMQQIFLELPLLGYVFAPERTQDTVTRFRAWTGRSGRTAAVIAAGVIGVWLLARGIITLLGASARLAAGEHPTRASGSIHVSRALVLSSINGSRGVIPRNDLFAVLSRAP